MKPEIALEKLLELRKLVDRVLEIGHGSADDGRSVHESLCLLYGELAEVFEQVVGVRKIPVPPNGSGAVSYPNYFEAAFMSGRTFYYGQGRNELLKIIGAMQRKIADLGNRPLDEPSISGVVSTLRRLRECCQYVRDVPRDERSVQDLVWIILRSQFDRLEREETLPRFGAKQYRPDFGIPDLHLLVEVKFIGVSTKTGDIQDEVLADVRGYLGEHTTFDSMVVLVYDHAHKLRDPVPFIEACRGVDGIVDVIVIPGIDGRDA